MPVIVDTDMAADDIMALAYLLREPTVDIRAVVVSGTGEAHASNGAQVARDLLGQLGSEDIPVAFGSDTPMTGTRAFPADWRTVSDGGYGLAMSKVPWVPTPAVDLISSTIRSSPTPVTILTLGPLTDLGQALQADPSLASRIAQVHVSGGAIDVPGNVAAEGGDPAATAAEWNLWIDPKADDIVMRAGIPIALVPLDATGKVPLTKDFADTVAADHGPAGADITYELLTRNPFLLTGSFFWDQLATQSLVDPSAVTLKDAKVRVVTDGAGAGSLVQDPAGTTVRYATGPDASRFQSLFLQGLRRGAPRAHPFTLAGSIHATFDGATCGGTPTSTLAPGTYALDYKSTASAGSLLAVLRLHDDSTWKQVLDYTADKSHDPVAPPDFVDVPATTGGIGGPGTAGGVVDLTAGTYGLVCLRDSPPAAFPAVTSFLVGG